MSLPACEIERNAPLTPFERVAAGLAILAPMVGILAVGAALTLLGGCKSFYENSGSSGRVGSLTAPIEISDGTDSITMRLLYSMDGAYWYTRKDSRVKATYINSYTNTYIGCVDKVGSQRFEIEVEPLYVGDATTVETNSVSTATQPAD